MIYRVPHGMLYLSIDTLVAIHCKNLMVVITNKDGYLSYTFVHWTLPLNSSLTILA